MLDDDDPASWEINPGDPGPDPDLGGEAWAEMTVDDLEILFSQYDDDYAKTVEYAGEVPASLWGEYAAAGYPGMNPEAHPGYQAPADEEMEDV